jgi:hypothetical protein
VISRRASQAAGFVTGLPEGIADDRAANDALAQASSVGLLRRQQEELFDFRYYWDSPGEAKEYIDEEWEGFVGIEPDVWKGIRHHWALADADARVCVRLSMLITRWKKLV